MTIVTLCTPNVSFIVKLDGNIKYVTCTCILLKWYKLKRPKLPLLNQLKTKLLSFPTLSLSLSHAYQPLSPNQNPCNPKSPNQNHIW